MLKFSIMNNIHIPSYLLSESKKGNLHNTLVFHSVVWSTLNDLVCVILMIYALFACDMIPGLPSLLGLACWKKKRQRQDR